MAGQSFVHFIAVKPLREGSVGPGFSSLRYSRPRYRLIERIVRTLPVNLQLLTTTATANDRVKDDLASVLGPGLEVMRGALAHPSLRHKT